MKTDSRRKSFQLLLYVFAIIGIAAIVYSLFMPTLTNHSLIPTTHAQQDPFLSQRINQIEQRLTSMETRFIRLEQESRLPSLTPRATENNDAEIQLLRSEISALQLRLAEAECGLTRLDERTLTAAARQARRRAQSGGEIDRCRQNPDAPIQLSVRP